MTKLAAILILGLSLLLPSLAHAQTGNVYPGYGPIAAGAGVSFTQVGSGYQLTVTASGGAPTGPASGALTGTYPAPTLAAPYNATTASGAARNLGLQFYADNCAGIVNDGTSDDALPLRNCLAAIATTYPNGGWTMNLDGAKPYFFNSSTITDPVWGGQQCDLVLKTPQSLNWNHASINYGSTDPNGVNESICVGTPNFNTPGTAGGSPTFDTIGTTTGNTSTITLTTHANAANYHTGDDIYVDCGVNTNHVGVGWSQVSTTGNASTGVLNLKYPLVKPYPGTNSVCVGQTPRIYDWTTSGGGSSGANLGPLANNITIDGGGGSITTASNTTSAPFTWEGSNNVTLANMTIFAQSFAVFANNNHLATINNVHVIGQGCSSDFVLYSGQFASAFNTVENSSVNATGIGCAAHVIPFGDSEGAESMTWTNDTATIQAAAAGTLIAGMFEFESWNIQLSQMKIQDDASGGYGYAEQTSTGTDGPKFITNSTIISPNQTAALLQTNGDQLIGNTLQSNAQVVYIQGAGGVTVQGNQIVNGSSSFGAVEVQGGYCSTISGNTLNCANGSCGAGFNVVNPGSSNTCPLTIISNSVPLGSGQYTGVGLGAQTNLPNLTVVPSTVADPRGVLSCYPCTFVAGNGTQQCYFGGPNSAKQVPYFDTLYVVNPNSISCVTPPTYFINDFTAGGTPQSSTLALTSGSNTPHTLSINGGLTGGTQAVGDTYAFQGSGGTCTCTLGSTCNVSVSVCLRW